MSENRKWALDKAKSYAMVAFDEWNDVTGFVIPGVSYYCEIIGLLNDAVEYGFGIANGATIEEIKKRIGGGE